MDTKKKLAALGLTAGLIGGGAAGAILGSGGVSGATTAAATQDDTTTTTPDPSAPDATAPDADGDAERGPGRFLEDALAPLVEDGTITQDQADDVIAAIQAARPEGRGPGHGGGRGHGMMVGGLSAATDVLGVEEDDLLTLLRNGATLAEVAEQKGVDPQAVIDALVAEVKEHLDEEVASGEHTQEEVDAKLADATERITEMVNEGGPMHGLRGGPGASDDADAGADAEGN